MAHSLAPHPAGSGRGAAWADRLERLPGAGALVSFQRHLRFNLPRSTTAGGVLLLLGIAAIRVYLLVASATGWVAPGASAPIRPPVYLLAYFAVVAAGALLAAAGMLSAPRRVLTRVGWALGSLVCAAAMAMYLVSRTAGLPGGDRWVGRWDQPLGTFALAVEGAFLITHLAVLTGMTVAVPDRRDWRD